LFGAEAINGGLPLTGLFERAHGGTLYLDEVGDMPLETQGKILRILVDQKFERLGGRSQVQVDVRVVSSAGADLREKILLGTFREDLFHRLNVVPVRVPPLAERREDIPLLVAHLMQRLAVSLRTQPRKLSDDAIATMQTYDWPGNVRQLRNVIERLLIFAPDDVERPITGDLLPAELGAATPLLLRAGGGGSSAAARGARNVRARLSDCPDRQVWRQHFTHRGLYRHGAVRAAPQAEIAWRLSQFRRACASGGGRGMMTLSDIPS
jgi:two-component system, NtrC family, nitrogen regulation response regulator NtrX